MAIGDCRYGGKVDTYTVVGDNMKIAANSVGDGLIRPAYLGRKTASPTDFHRWQVRKPRNEIL